MADPKYANLFGIAYDQPDVYETDDLPEADQGTGIYEEEESDAIERLHIAPNEAFSKFKDKHLQANKVDFSDRLSKRIRTGYDARSGDWELAGAGEKETVFQKYQRLQCEMKELTEEIATLKDKAKEEAKSEGAPFTNFSNQLEGMLKQVSELDLQEMLGGEICDGNRTNADQMQKLFSHLDQLRSGGGEGGGVKPEKGDECKEAAIRYQLAVSPGQAALAQTSRIANLEQRLNKIESVVGASSTKMSRLGCGDRSLVEVAQYLTAKTSLLDPTQLDAAEIRVSALATKLDQVAEKAAAITGSQDQEKEKKIAILYDLAKEAEQISKILPQTLDRMVALQSLHQQSSEFTKSLGELESLQSRLNATAESNNDLLKKVETSLVDNLATIRSNIENLDGRVTTLTSKK